jgi:hypothetical protein
MSVRLITAAATCLLLTQPPGSSSSALDDATVDFVTPGASVSNVTATESPDQSITINGLLRSLPSHVPVLFVSHEDYWLTRPPNTVFTDHSPQFCTHHLCCLSILARAYRHAQWTQALSALCADFDSTMPAPPLPWDTVAATAALLADATTQYQSGVSTFNSKSPSPESTFSATFTLRPAFVVLVLLAPTPPVLSFIPLEFTWLQRRPGPLSIAWRGPQCVEVLYRSSTVCIRCDNRKPDFSVFVFTSRWMTTHVCDWVCVHGYYRVNDQCFPEWEVVASVVGIVSLLGVLAVGGMWYVRPRRRAAPVVPPPPSVLPSSQAKAQAPNLLNTPPPSMLNTPYPKLQHSANFSPSPPLLAPHTPFPPVTLPRAPLNTPPATLTLRPDATDLLRNMKLHFS